MVYVIAHRGFSGKYPEDTLLSFRKAIELGVDYIELDVYVSLDSRMIVIHDPRLNRTTNGHGRIVAKTFDEIRKYRTIEGNQPVPCLEEVFELVKNSKTKINIELKTAWAAKPTADLIKEYGMKDKVLISSGKPLALKIMKHELPNVRTAYLFFVTENQKLSMLVNVVSSFLSELTKYLIMKTSDSLKVGSVNVTYPFAVKGFIKKLHKKGYEVNIWVVNTPALMKKIINNGADGIITNRPDLLMKVLDGKQKKRKISLKKIRLPKLPKIRLRKK